MGNAERDRAARALVRETKRPLTLAECEAEAALRPKELTLQVLREYCRAADVKPLHGSTADLCSRLATAMRAEKIPMEFRAP